MKIELRSTPHRKIPVTDILPNPHRDLELNPVSPERIGQLLESFERTGFWDNIVVREHPTRESKYQLAYGHNRLAALKNNGVDVDTITIPVAKLSDWEMYCAMVDENEMQGAVTVAVAMENIGKGCDLIEKALKKVGKDGTWEAFNEAVGRSVPVGTERKHNDHGFEKVRSMFFEGEGLGRSFLAEFLPCGKMRHATISTVINERYAVDREKAKRAEAKRKKAEADEKERLAREEEDAAERRRLEEEAAAARKEQDKLEDAADKIGKGHIDKKVLLMFDAPRTMSDFAQAVRKLSIDKKHHMAAAKFILTPDKQGRTPKEANIERELAIWWDQVSGAAAKRAKAAENERKQEKMRKATKGIDFTAFLLKIADDFGTIGERLDVAIQYIDQADSYGHKAVQNKFVPLAKKLNALIERSRAALDGQPRDVTPSKKMLSHQKAR